MTDTPEPVTGDPPIAGHGPDRTHVWQRSGLLMWEAFFALVLVATCVSVLNEYDRPLTTRIIAAVLLLGQVGWYLGYGRRIVRAERQGAPATVYLTGIGMLQVGASLAVPGAAFALFALCPMCFIAARVRKAIIAVVAISAVPWATSIADSHSLLGSVTTAAAAVVVIVFSAMMGWWIERIMQQSTERAQLIERLEASREEVSRLSHEAGRAAERERLASEIHDTLAQGFTSLVMLVQAADSEVDGDREAAHRHLSLAERTARENLAEARALVAAMPPAALEESTLADALRRITERTGEEIGADGSLHTDGVVAVSPGVEVVLLRACQEALANVRKHAEASAVRVELWHRGERAGVTVRDDGVGFDPAARTAGYGLRGMRGRLEQVGGTVTVDSSPGNGTRVRIEVPA